jgi:hypothetical protein
VAELDLILRMNKEARSLDVDHFHDIIRTTEDDQILEVFKIVCRFGKCIMSMHPLASDTWGAKEPAFASHYCAAPGILDNLHAYCFSLSITAY